MGPVTGRLHRPACGVLLLLLLWCCSTGQAVRISIVGCVPGHDGTRYAELKEELDKIGRKNFTCTGISPDANVTWSLGPLITGSCGSDLSCAVSVGGDKIQLARPSSEESQISIGIDSRLKSNTLTCSSSGSSDSCDIDIVTPAQGTCRAQFQTDFENTLRPWNVSVDCSIASAKSSRNNFQCRLYQEKEGQFSAVTPWQPMTDSAQDRQCKMVTNLDATTLTHKYRVHLLPGSLSTEVKFNDSGTISSEYEIRRPDKPTFICSPSGLYVPKDSNLICICNTTSLGKPSGRLLWSKALPGQEFQTERLRKGPYPRNKLNITMTHEHPNMRFRCDVIWADHVIGPVKNISVGYPVSQVTLAISEGRPVPENSPAHFKCNAQGGVPPPTLTLRKNKTAAGDSGAPVLARSTSSLIHELPSARCEDSGMYTCTASNKMGPDRTDESKLNVTCKPRDMSQEMPPVNYIEEEVDFLFDVIANPPAYQVQFSFLGPLGENSSTVSEKVQGIALSGQCGRKEGGEVYESSCRVTVHNVTSAKAAGLYRATVSNQQGHLHFEFEVKVNATVPDPNEESAGLSVGLGIGVAVVLVAVLLIVVFIYRRRKQESAKTQTKTRDSDGVRYTTAPATTAAGGERANGTSDHRQPLLLSDQGDGDPASQLYAVVQKSPAKQKRLEGRQKKEPGDSNLDRPLLPEPGKEREEDNVYAVVNKKTKPAAAAASATSSLSSVVPLENVPWSEGGGGGGGGQEESGEEEDPSGGAPIYGNIDVPGGFPSKPANDAGPSSAPEASSAAEDGREVNQDGLVYVSVDFSHEKPSTKHSAPPPEESVLYSAVDFQRTAPAQ